MRDSPARRESKRKREKRPLDLSASNLVFPTSQPARLDHGKRRPARDPLGRAVDERRRSARGLVDALARAGRVAEAVIDTAGLDAAAHVVGAVQGEGA